jgi:dihydrofolate reductase
MTKTILVVACDSHTGAIGNGGGLYHSMPGDLAFFRKLTKETSDPENQNMVIMGRKTWNSLPKRPLVGRVNVVFSRSITEETTEGAYVIRNLDQLVPLIEQNQPENIYVIGGKEIYDIFLKNRMIDELYITMMYPRDGVKTPNADTYFDLTHLKDFNLESKTPLSEDVRFKAYIEHYTLNFAV